MLCSGRSPGASHCLKEARSNSSLRCYPLCKLSFSLHSLHGSENMMFKGCLLLVAQLFSTVGRVGDESNQSAPVATVKAGSPIEALQSLEAAVKAGDEPAILALTITKTARQRRVYDMYVQGWARNVSFYNAIKHRFGEEGLKNFFQLGWPYVSRWINLDDAKVEIDGDTSVVSSGLHKQRLFREDGRWKVFFADWDEKALDHFEKWNLSGLADAMRVLTPKIRAGRYRNLNELGLEFRHLWGVDQSDKPMG